MTVPGYGRVHGEPIAHFSLKSETDKAALLLCMLILVVFVWGGFARITSAVVAPGRIVYATSIKKIQHREGGIVKEVLVSEGQQVTVGQTLIRLDPTVINAHEGLLQKQIWELLAAKARLLAERDNLTPTSITAPINAPAEYRQIMLAERQLMIADLLLKKQRKDQLQDQVVQSLQEITGLEAQADAEEKQSELIEKELVSVKSLYEKGYAPFTQVSALQREAERLNGTHGELVASIAKARVQIDLSKTAILQVDSEALGHSISDLKETETKLASLQGDQIATQDTQSRNELKAPVGGRIQQLTVHTPGGVVAAGETLMIIAPEREALTVEARIDPAKIDEVHAGAKAHIRFIAFNTSITPQATGLIDTVSSDVEIDEKTGINFYRARINLSGITLPYSVRKRVLAGMPVEVQVETASRSALSYFLRPLTERIEHTFKD